MGAALTGGPYYVVEFVATTQSIMVESVADALTNSGWSMVDKVAAWASALPISQPADNTAVTLDATTLRFKNTPTLSTHVQIGATLPDTITNFVNKVTSLAGTVGASYDVTTNQLTLSYYVGGSFGNRVSVSGWLTWESDVTYGVVNTNQLWLGGYKFKTGFRSTGAILGAIPSIVYVFENSADSRAHFRFMSSDQSILGKIQTMNCAGSPMRYVGSPAQFFLRRTDTSGDPSGSFLCGGSFYVNYDPNNPPHDAWYSMCDCLDNPFFVASTPRTAYGNGLASGAGGGGWADSIECCFDGSYTGQIGHNSAITPQLSLWRMSDWPTLPQQYNTPTRYGGDPIVSEPFLLGGGYFRGQLYDCLTVGKPFSTGYTSDELAAAYPWSDGSTLADGTPKNRLSPDFDQAKWENITDNYVYASLFIITTAPKARGKFNYAYEGKA